VKFFDIDNSGSHRRLRIVVHESGRKLKFPVIDAKTRDCDAIELAGQPGQCGVTFLTYGLNDGLDFVLYIRIAGDRGPG
jgi:hypothetical protein